MEIHQPDNIGTARLKGKRLDLVCRFAVRLQSIGRVGKTSAFLYHLTNAVDRVKNISRIDTSRCRCRQCQVASVFEDAVQRGGCWKDARPSVVLAQCDERGCARKRRSCCRRITGLVKQAEPAAGLFEREQFRITNPEQGTTKDRNE